MPGSTWAVEQLELVAAPLLAAAFSGAEIAAAAADFDDHRGRIEVEVDAGDVTAVAAVHPLDLRGREPGGVRLGAREHLALRCGDPGEGTIGVVHTGDVRRGVSQSSAR